MTTKIEWVARPGTTPETWNPVTGCTKVSEGCAHCYAERMARRLAGRYGYPEAPHHFDVTLHPDRLEQPLRWRKARTVFVCSMSDLFHEDIPFAYIDRVFDVMERAREHTFQVLTKRAARLAEYCRARIADFGADILPNVWLGVTAENQARAHERITHLLSVPAVVRFVSIEPMLGPVKLNGVEDTHEQHHYWRYTLRLDWVIVGGESGPGSRPMRADWARMIRDQCIDAKVPFFFKQWGAWLPFDQCADAGVTMPIVDAMNYATTGAPVRVGKNRAGHLLDGKEHHEWPVAKPTPSLL